MELTFDQIKPLIHGAVRFLECDGGLMPCRFTEAQERVYAKQSAGSHKKSLASAGVRLCLRTNTRHLSMTAEIRPGSTRKRADFDVYADGRMIKADSFEIKEEGCSVCVSVDFPACGHDRQITVYFPWSASTAIRSLSLDDGATVIPQAKKKRSMICFGDSITQGYDCSNPSLSYANQLTDALDAEAVNKGIGGAVFLPALAAERDAFDPDIVTVAYGTNDWARSEKEVFKRDSKAFYEYLCAHYPRARIFAITPIWRGNSGDTDKSVGTFSYVHAYLKDVASAFPNVTLIDGIDLVPHDLRCFMADGLHPCNEGFRHYASNLYAAIKPHI